MDFDFGAFIVIVIILTVVANSVWMPLTLSPATYDGPGQPGDSGVVVAGSGNEPAEMTSPEGTEMDSLNADQWHITFATTEDPTAPTTQDGLTIKITLESDDSTVAWIAEAICIVCVIIMLAIVAMLWVVVRKEFMNG